MRRLPLILALLLSLGLWARTPRTVTPVNPVSSRPVASPKEKVKKLTPEEEAEARRPKSVVEHTDDQGHTFWLDTISGNEWVDSMALAQTKVIGNIYPLWDAVSVGVDLWPTLGRAFGQHHGLVGVWGRLSLHNRYFPVLELGLGSAAKTPSGMNYSYKSPVAPYVKLGMDYNFFYNSNPDYQVFASVRYGLTRFKYSVYDVTVTDSYWGETFHPEFPEQTTLTGYLEIGAGIQVKIWGPISAGWSIKYHRILHHSAETYGAPWAVPGFGGRDGELGVSLSLIYTIPLHEPIPDKSSNNE